MARLPSCHLQVSVATLALVSLTHLVMSSSSSHHHHRRNHRHPSSSSLSFADQYSGHHPDEGHSGPLLSSESENTAQCDACAYREVQKEARIEFLKKKILSQLGMQTPPNVTANRRVIPAISPLSNIQDEYEMQGMAPHSHYHSRQHDNAGQGKAIIMKFLTPVTPPFFVVGSNNETDVYFRFRSDLLPSQISLAKLYVYIKGTTSGPIGNSVLLVQVLTANGQANVIGKKRILVGGRRNGDWIQVNIRSQVRQWLAHPGTNYGLRIEALDMTGKNLALVNPHHRDEEAYVPVLEVKDFPPSRVRRGMNGGMVCHENSTETSCCLFPLKVDFSKFGWDWIIAPRKYTANYCAGKCGFVYKTTHRVTHIVQQSIPRNQVNAGPCCAPRQLKPLRLVYFDDHGQIIWGHLAAMIVAECGCA